MATTSTRSTPTTIAIRSQPRPSLPVWTSFSPPAPRRTARTRAPRCPCRSCSPVRTDPPPPSPVRAEAPVAPDAGAVRPRPLRRLSACLWAACSPLQACGPGRGRDPALGRGEQRALGEVRERRRRSVSPAGGVQRCQGLGAVDGHAEGLGGARVRLSLLDGHRRGSSCVASRVSRAGVGHRLGVASGSRLGSAPASRLVRRPRLRRPGLVGSSPGLERRSGRTGDDGRASRCERHRRLGVHPGSVERARRGAGSPT